MHCQGNPTAYHPSVGDAGGDAAISHEVPVPRQAGVCSEPSPTDALEERPQQDPQVASSEDRSIF